ncbi:MAG: uroporphyrinogen-III synthase [Sphingomonadales bacterium]
MRVLIIRPEPGNSATAAAVRAMGHEPVCVPLFEVVPVAWDAPDPAKFDAIAMTSANAARHGGATLDQYRHLPVFAVGEATAATARDAGFATISMATGDAAALGKTLSGRVLHLAGTDFRRISTDAYVTVRSVYAATPLDPVRPLDADIALVHSARAGERLALLALKRKSLKIIAISASAAQACGDGWRQLDIPFAPHHDAMLECLARLCEAGRPSPASPVV